MFHPESYRGRIIEFRCFALLCLFNDTCMILLALHKLSGKDGLYPGLIWIMGLLEVFLFCFYFCFFVCFYGLRVLVFKERLWVVALYSEPSWCYMGSVLSPFLPYAPSLLF